MKMVRIPVIGAVAFALVVLSAAVAAADSTTPNELVLNPQIGINGSTLSNNPENIEFYAKLGWQIGGYIRYGKRFYFQPGVFWHYQNTETTQDVGSIDDFEFQQKISTIQVPLCLGYNIIYADALVLRIFGGGVLSFLTSVDENDYIDEDDINSTQWLGRVGLGLDFLMFTADLGYDFGISNFYSDELIAHEDTSDHQLDGVKIKEFYLSVGLKF